MALVRQVRDDFTAAGMALKIGRIAEEATRRRGALVDRAYVRSTLQRLAIKDGGHGQAESFSEEVHELDPTHPARVHGRSVFASKIREPRRKILAPGAWSPKLGGRVTKGPLAGAYIRSLTLEERATCPRSCENWARCYGNNMHLAVRYRHGADLERAIGLPVLGAVTLALTHTAVTERQRQLKWFGGGIAGLALVLVGLLALEFFKRRLVA
jgi:hypothetical protein